MSTRMAAAEQISIWRERVETSFPGVFADRPGIPARLAQAMEYAVSAGGKRLRPTLVLASCHAAGGSEEQALPAALGIELIHTYSLIHDDLPAMDDDDLRRGKPATHVAFGEALGILAGDALHTLAFELLALAPLPEDRIVAQVLTLALAAGAAGMAGGQVLDLEAEGSQPTEASVGQIHRLKTGALLQASLELGAHAAGAEAEMIAELGRAGSEVGLAFQIRDDILDATASSDELGKTAGKDAAAGKATWPALVGLEESERRATTLASQALERLSELGPAAEPLRHLVRLAVDRRN